MAQLSTDSLAYSQIITFVQQFVDSHVNNQNVTPKEFDAAYKQMLSKIRSVIGSPLSELDLINKGDIPSSKRFNAMVGSVGADINLITNQLDALTANYVNSFNVLNQEIESEKSSLVRIRSKIAALEMYSGSSSGNISYMGDLLNNMDLIDVSKTKGIQVCDVVEGSAILPKKSATKWKSNISLYNQNYNDLNSDQNTSPFGVSNGLAGCNFLFSRGNFNNITDPYLFQKDLLTVKTDPTRMIDESPVSFYEYEAIRLEKNQNSITRPDHEFLYINGNNTVDWSNFGSTKPLKLTVELTSTKSTGENVNYISIVPFFGYDEVGLNARIKNIKVTSIKLYNTTTNRLFEVINNGPVYIGGDIAGSTINNYSKYFYNKGIFRLSQEYNVNKIYITFEQDVFNDVSIKHIYWEPYSSSDQASPKWRNQIRFNPELGMPDNYVAGSLRWNKNLIMPPLERPNSIKSLASDSVRVDLSYSVNTPVQNNRLKLTKSTDDFKYYDKKETFLGKEYYIFKDQASVNITPTVVDSIKSAILTDVSKSACVYLGQNETLSTKKIDLSNITIGSSTAVSGGYQSQLTINCSEQHNLSVGDYVSLKGTIRSATVEFDEIYQVGTIVNSTSFTVIDISANQVAAGTSTANNVVCMPLYTKAEEQKLTKDTESRMVPKVETEQVFLKRKYETLGAKRASIGIRDIFVGKELFSDKAEIISKPFYIYDNIDLVSLEVQDQVPSTDDSSTSIDYYISVDDGIKWIQISPIQRNFVGIPEIVSFNQNIPSSAAMPQIAYYNYPEVPNPIKSIRFRAVMKKDRNSNATPILGSYKLGVRFKQ